MSFPRYPKYKQSGVEWLGDVPEHWGICTLRRVTSACCDGPFGSGLKSEHYRDHGVRVIRLQNIKARQFDDRDSAFIDATYCAETLGDHYVEGGDLLIAGLGDENNTVGRACVAPQDLGRAMVKADCFRFRLDRGSAEPAFVAAALCSGAKHAAGTLATGSTRSRISLTEMASRRLPLPPLPEQRAIAAFLDRETAKIDGLVAEQQRLIELLKEKRQAVISHAVTKGLDPKAPMKPSGVEWLGDVPAHWEVLPLHRIVDDRRRITYGIVQPGEPDPAGRFMIRGQDYSNGWASPDDVFRVSEAVEVPYKRARVVPGDLVITIVGAGVGNIAQVPDWLNGANLTQTTARIAINHRRADPIYVAAVLQGPIGKRSVGLYAKGAAQPGLNIEHVRTFLVTLPPLPEQRGIAAFLNRETERIDSLVAETESAITLLQERRSALISAAVTGQIDVRNAVATEAA